MRVVQAHVVPQLQKFFSARMPRLLLGGWAVSPLLVSQVLSVFVETARPQVYKVAAAGLFS